VESASTKESTEDIFAVGSKVFVCTAQEQYVEGQIIASRRVPADDSQLVQGADIVAGRFTGEVLYRVRYRGWGVEHDNWVQKNQLATADSNTKSILVNDVSQGLKTTN
jgi:hypothetical protein